MARHDDGVPPARQPDPGSEVPGVVLGRPHTVLRRGETINSVDFPLMRISVSLRAPRRTNVRDKSHDVQKERYSWRGVTPKIGRRQIGHGMSCGSTPYVTLAGPFTTMACCTVSFTVTVTTTVDP
ncbi:hypothetical protein BH09GEM1_BH09GEM1_19310 [soil metagenome]